MPESRSDVLIIGAGPAGLLLATELAKLKVDTRIIDIQAHRVLRGHADGLQCRTCEVFAALGVKSRFDDEAHECAEVVIYSPNEKGDGIEETDRLVDTLPGTSHVKHVNLGQDRVEAILIDAMKRFNDLEVDRLLQPTDLQVDESKAQHSLAFPIKVTLRKLPPPTELANGDVTSGLYRSNLFATEQHPAAQPGQGEDSELVHCKYVVGCDGARSWVRKQLGLELKGDSSNVYWGAFDAIIKTDLPSIRMKNSVKSPSAGTVITVPREDGLVRVYTQMGDLAPGQRVNRDDVTLEKMIRKTQDVFQPYKLEFPYVDWYTCYEIGQRICDTFSKHDNRVFIAGDACHTHSPKAGQGMNVSMMDSWNLGWKLASVLRGRARPDILATYQSERHAAAKELIDFDYKWARMLMGKTDLDGKPITAEATKAAWDQSQKYTSGTAVCYRDSILSDIDDSRPELANKLHIGSHFFSRQVVDVAAAHAIQLQERLRADGRWRIIIFAGDVRRQNAQDRLLKLASQLKPIVSRYTPASDDSDSVIEVLTVCETPHRDVQLAAASWPDLLIPTRAPYGVRAFDTLFSDEPSTHDGHGQAYEGYGVDVERVAVVVVRPDQYVAGIYGLEDSDRVASFFDKFMLVSAEV